MTSPSNSPGGASFPPQPPPTSNNGIYIGIAVVMLLGIGAVLVFKRGDAAPEVTAPAPSAVPAEQESKLDEVPPPPPETDSGPAPAPTSKVSSVQGPNPDCLPKAKCNGKANEELETALGSRARQARRCYEAALKDDSTLKGKIALTVRVAGNGNVCNATVTQDEIPAISGCVERVFRSAGTFPKPAGGCTDVVVPMSFVPNR